MAGEGKKVRKKDPTNPWRKDSAIGILNRIWQEALSFCGGDKILAALMVNESALAGLPQIKEKWSTAKKVMESLLEPRGQRDRATDGCPGQEEPGRPLVPPAAAAVPECAPVSQEVIHGPDCVTVVTVTEEPCQQEDNLDNPTILPQPTLKRDYEGLSLLAQARIAIKHAGYLITEQPRNNQWSAYLKKDAPCVVCEQTMNNPIQLGGGYWIRVFGLKDSFQGWKKVCQLHRDVVEETFLLDHAEYTWIATTSGWVKCLKKQANPPHAEHRDSSPVI